MFRSGSIYSLLAVLALSGTSATLQAQTSPAPPNVDPAALRADIDRLNGIAQGQAWR